MARRITSSIFVGRVAERARLEALLEATVDGEPGLVLIGGDAGIGKSRLVAEFERMARLEGLLTVRGHCLESIHGGVPWAPFADVLRQIQHHAPEAVAALRDVSRDEIARMVPSLDDIGVSEPADPTGVESPLRLYHAVDDLLSAITRDRPLALIVEDIHWADASSLDLLRFVAARPGSRRLLVTATFRSDELRRTYPLRMFLAEVVRLPNVERMELPPLTRSEVADQITGITGERAPGSLVDQIVQRSDGSPFFVEELMAAHTDGRSQSQDLHDVLGGRISHLTPEGQMVMGLAAALGRDVDHALLARVAPVPDDRLTSALHEAVANHLLVPNHEGPAASFRFRHALVQEFAYGQLLPPERVKLHAAIARTLEKDGGSSAEIAHHAYRAHDLPTALAHSVAAALEAATSMAFAGALVHVERSLELWAAVPDSMARAGRNRSALLMLGARCAAAAGHAERARDLARQALEEHDGVADRDARIGVLLDLYFLEADAGDVAGRDRATIEAAELVPRTPPSALLARVLVNLAGVDEQRGRPEEALRLAEEALEVARAADAADAEVEALLRLADIEGAAFGQAVTAIAHLDRAAQILAVQTGTPDGLVGRLQWLRAWRAVLAGYLDQALGTIDAWMAWAAGRGLLGQYADSIREVRIVTLTDLGRWAEADSFIDEARLDGPLAYHRILYAFAPMMIRRGQLGTVAEVREPRTGGQYDAGSDVESAILLANAERRLDDARAMADEALSALPGPLHDASLWFVLMAAIEGEADRADAARRRRHTAEADTARRVGLSRVDLLERSLSAAIDRGGTGPRAEALLTLAIAERSRLEGRPDDALWSEAASRHDALGFRWHSAYARFHQAKALLGSRGARPRATEVVRDAHRIAVELGAVTLQEQIEGLARRGRVDLQTGPTSRPGRVVTDEGVAVALTSREQEVLALVAAGHTNREIGAQLFISDKTASVHVTNAMDKLGALSRYDAAARATRLGLFGEAPRRHEVVPDAK